MDPRLGTDDPGPREADFAIRFNGQSNCWTKHEALKPETKFDLFAAMEIYRPQHLNIYVNVDVESDFQIKDHQF